jgi:rubrerythrin
MERMPSIELAIRNEQAEKAYYLNEARRTANPVARTLFQELARDEDEHMRRLGALHEKLKSAGSWPADVPLVVAATDVKQKLASLVRETGSHAQNDLSDLEALRKAEAFEANGAAFYKELAAACADPREKAFFELLSGIEREHLASVQDSIFYLEDPHGWLAARERSGLDGA